MVDAAIDTLFDAMKTGPPCPVCGRSDSDRDAVTVKAAQLVLDRAGFHPTLTVKHEAPDDMPWVYFLTDEQLAAFGQWEAEAREKMRLAEDPFGNWPVVKLLPPIGSAVEGVVSGTIPKTSKVDSRRGIGL